MVAIGAVRQALDGQKQLVLLRLHPGARNLFFAEAEKAPDLVPELGQSAILLQREILHHLYRNTI